MRVLTIELDAALVEPFGDVLLEAGAASVEIADADAGTDREQPVYAEPGTGAGPEPQPWSRSRVRVLVGDGVDPFALVTEAAMAAGLEDTPAYAVQILEDQDWVRATQAQFAPFRVGRRFWVVPSWHEPPQTDAIVLRIDPGRAFGTGSHATTRLILEWLEEAVQPGMSLLDYGCGSGILAIAAARLGASRVDAVDIDPQAVETAAANARDNGAQVRVSLPQHLGAAQYDIVVANILAQPLVALAPLLADRLAPRGRIALSGVLETQAAEVAAAYAPGVTLETGAVVEGWVLLKGERR
jgi:ribosomal protein L11 methyltransferase